MIILDKWRISTRPSIWHERVHLAIIIIVALENIAILAPRLVRKAFIRVPLLHHFEKVSANSSNLEKLVHRPIQENILELVVVASRSVSSEDSHHISAIEGSNEVVVSAVGGHFELLIDIVHITSWKVVLGISCVGDS